MVVYSIILVDIIDINTIILLQCCSGYVGVGLGITHYDYYNPFKCQEVVLYLQPLNTLA